MAVHKIKNTVNTAVVADKANDSWIVTEQGKVDTMDVGINADGPARGREIIVQGFVAGLEYGITFGDMTRKGGGLIEIDRGGTVESADTAVLSRGNDQHVINKGTIGGVEGIVSKGNRLDVVNDGVFDTSNTGITVQEGSGRIVNNGEMYGEAAIYVESTAGTGRVTVINNGLMDTTKGAIQLLSDGNHLIVNRGEITSYVFGGKGNDRFVNDGGKVAGDVDLLEGNDTYVIDRSSFKATEQLNSGSDTVKASVDYTISENIEKLVLTGQSNTDGTGNSGDNRLQGNAANNRLDGWGGDDLLKGAGGNDVFVFSYHGGSDQILDFKSGEDRIDMRGWDGNGLENFSDVKANATEIGKDLLISDGGSDDLLIHDFSKSDLDKADFIF